MGLSSSMFDKYVLLSLKRRLFSGGAWAFAGRVGTMFFGLASNALLARLLSPQDLGTYFLAFSVASFGAMAGSLGLNQAAVRLIAESLGTGQFGRTRRVVGAVIVLGVLGILIIGCLYLLLLGRFLGTDLFDAPSLVAITWLVAGWMAVLTWQEILSGVFRGFHDIRWATVFGGLMTSVLLATSLLLLWLFQEESTLATVVLLAIVSGGASALLGGWLLRLKVTSIPLEGALNQRAFKTVAGVAWPLLITNLTLFALMQVDLWILGAFRSQEEVAIYGAAARLAALVVAPLAVVNAVVPPLIAEMYAQGRRGELERMLRFTAALAAAPALLTVLGFTILGVPILTLVYGGYYREGTVVLALLSLGQMASVLTGSCALTLMMTGHQVTSMIITVAAGVLMIIVALQVVDPYGATGVAVATCGGLVFQNVVMWLMAKRKTGIWTHFSFSVLRSIRGFS
ncbi:oligosaccharide flippase family protein [Rubrobacter xylanophilus]|nr:oligosaccharide flippase family protein [Rubrobacter xylanophilus]